MGFMDRVLSWIGFEVETVEEEVAAAEEPVRREPSRSRRSRTERSTAAAGPVVALPGSVGSIRIVIVTPRHFEDVQVVADHLKARRPVIINLENTDRELTHRIINFLSGTIYALNGEMHRVGSHVVFFAPGGVEVAVEGRPVRRSSGGEQPSSGIGGPRE